MSEITFKEDTHQYFNEKGQEYISATTFIKMFAFPFDEDGASRRVAEREGITQEEVLARWKKASDEACAYGTLIHAQMENYLKKGTINPNYPKLYRSFDNILEREMFFNQEVLSEYKLHNDEYMIAGTADLIIDLDDEEFLVGDFKTNKEIKFFDRFGNHMSAPVSHLSSSNYNIYSLQLSLYAYFYSLKSGKKCRNVFLLYCPDEEGWTFIPANYMEYEVRAMLKYYNNHKEEMLNNLNKNNENISAESKPN